MPAWAQLPRAGPLADRHIFEDWLLGHAVPVIDECIVEQTRSLPPPHAPFTDFRYEKPGAIRRISVKDLPAPFLRRILLKNQSQMWWRGAATIGQRLPRDSKWTFMRRVWIIPAQFAWPPMAITLLQRAIQGTSKCFGESRKMRKPQQVATFASGLHEPYGIAFYPPGSRP